MTPSLNKRRANFFHSGDSCFDYEKSRGLNRLYKFVVSLNSQFLCFYLHTRLYAASPRAALPRHDAASPRARKAAASQAAGSQGRGFAAWPAASPSRPRLCRARLCRDIVCHTVAGTHAGTYVPRLILGLVFKFVRTIEITIYHVAVAAYSVKTLM